MNQPKKPQPNFTMNLNFKRKTNERAPTITGRISTPEDPETEFAYVAYEKIDKTGQTYWIGPVEHHRSMRQALNQADTYGTHFVAIRENGFKVFKEHHDGTPNPAYAALTPEQQAHEDSKPAYWATWTRGENDPQLRASAWEREPNRYGPWASGNTQYPLTKEQAEAQRAAEQAQDMAAPAGAFAPEQDSGKSRRRTSKADDAGR